MAETDRPVATASKFTGRREVADPSHQDGSNPLSKDIHREQCERGGRRAHAGGREILNERKRWRHVQGQTQRGHQTEYQCGTGRLLSVREEVERRGNDGTDGGNPDVPPSVPSRTSLHDESARQNPRHPGHAEDQAVHQTDFAHAHPELTHEIRRSEGRRAVAGHGRQRTRGHEVHKRGSRRQSSPDVAKGRRGSRGLDHVRGAAFRFADREPDEQRKKQSRSAREQERRAPAKVLGGESAETSADHDAERHAG